MYLITDFGASFKHLSGSVTTMKETMTSFYASIEQFELEETHSSFDIWSVGIIGYKLISKKEPYT